RKCCVCDVEAIDPDRSRMKLLGHTMGLRAISSPYSGRQPVIGVIGFRDDTLRVAEGDGADHWSEYLLTNHLHSGFRPDQDRGFKKVPGPRALPAACNDLGSFI